MRAVSAAFLRTITGSHSMVARARVCTTFLTGTNPVGWEIPILAGDVKLDGTAQIRATLDMTTSGDGTWPTLATDLLTPYGNEVYVERGVQYSDESVEYVGLGYFRIQTPAQGRAPNGPIRLTGRDRMAGIVDGRLLAPRQFLIGTTLGSIFTTLVGEVYPAATIVWDDASNANTLTRAVQCDEDRYAFLDNIVRSLGKIWYWNHRGELSIRTPPSPTAPVFTVAAGAGGVLLELSRELTRTGVYNACVARGEGLDSNPPAYGVAYDNNPKSPTYFLGRFGPVPRFYSSPFLANDAQAQSAAAAILRREIGLPYNVEFTVSPNPALEPWDSLAVRAGINERIETHILETLSVPLVQSGAMSAKTREQTVVLIRVGSG